MSSQVIKSYTPCTCNFYLLILNNELQEIINLNSEYEYYNFGLNSPKKCYFQIKVLFCDPLRFLRHNVEVLRDSHSGQDFNFILS